MTPPDPAQGAKDLLTCPTHPVIGTVCAHVLKKIEQAIQAAYQAGRVDHSRPRKPRRNRTDA